MKKFGKYNKKKYRQINDAYCYPAVAKIMLSHYFNIEISQKEIAKDMRSTISNGTSEIELGLYFLKNGLTSKIFIHDDNFPNSFKIIPEEDMHEKMLHWYNASKNYDVISYYDGIEDYLDLGGNFITREVRHMDLEDEIKLKYPPIISLDCNFLYSRKKKEYPDHGVIPFKMDRLKTELIDSDEERGGVRTYDTGLILAALYNLKPRNGSAIFVRPKK